MPGRSNDATEQSPPAEKSPRRKKKMKELRESPSLKRFINPLLIKALGHPVREHVLAVANERMVSGTQVARELETDVSTIFHVFEELEELGFIEEVEVRGKERLFRARTALLIEEDGWERVPSTVKKDMRVSVIRSIFDDVFEALRHGTPMLGDQSHVSWLPAVLDAQGRREVKILLDQTLLRLVAIQRQSMIRIAKTGVSGIPTTMALLGFETNLGFARPSAFPC